MDILAREWDDCLNSVGVKAPKMARLISLMVNFEHIYHILLLLLSELDVCGDYWELHGFCENHILLFSLINFVS